MSVFIKVAKVEEIPEDQGYLVMVEGRALALFRKGEAVYALQNECPHQGRSLSEGGIHGYLVMCPSHGWEFDVRSGASEFNPGICAKTFEVKVKKGEVWVKL